MHHILGRQGKDIITGFEGTITGIAEYLTGCLQYLLNPGKVNDKGAVVEGVWFDAVRVKVIGAPMQLEPTGHEAQPTGPDTPAPGGMPASLG